MFIARPELLSYRERTSTLMSIYLSKYKENKLIEITNNPLLIYYVICNSINQKSNMKHYFRKQICPSP